VHLYGISLLEKCLESALFKNSIFFIHGAEHTTTCHHIMSHDQHLLLLNYFKKINKRILLFDQKWQKKTFTLLQGFQLQINAVLLNLLFIKKSWKRFITVSTKELSSKTVFNIDDNMKCTNSACVNNFWRIIVKHFTHHFIVKNSIINIHLTKFFSRTFTLFKNTTRQFSVHFICKMFPINISHGNKKKGEYPFNHHIQNRCNFLLNSF